MRMAGSVPETADDAVCMGWTAPAVEPTTARGPDHDVDGVQAVGRRLLRQAGELVADRALVLVLRLGRCVLLLLLAPLLVQLGPPGLLGSVRLAFVRLQTWAAARGTAVAAWCLPAGMLEQGN